MSVAARRLRRFYHENQYDRPVRNHLASKVSHYHFEEFNKTMAPELEPLGKCKKINKWELNMFICELKFEHVK